jgi:PAS domain S-box-containing protein
LSVANTSGHPFGLLKFTVLGCLPVLSLALLLFSRSVSAAESATNKDVLILESFSDRHLVGAESLESDLRARVPGAINFYVEYLRGRQFDDPRYERAIVEALQSTYGAKKLNLVMVQSYPALKFTVKHRDELFPGVPIVFWWVNPERFDGQKMWPGVTGVTHGEPYRETIELALHLHPDTDTVAVVTGNSSFDLYWLGRVQIELLRYQPKVKEIDLVGVPSDQLLEKLAALPLRTVVLFQQLPEESIQPAMGDFETLAWIGQRLPTYCIFPVLCLNHGGVGGVDIDMKKHYSLAAAVAIRVLEGEKPDDIPVADDTAQQIRLDWRELRRWTVPESAVPSGSVLLYREPSIWERGRRYFLAGIAVIVVQTLLILGLLWQRTRKRKAESVLRESEKRFRVMADSTPSLIWMCDDEGKITYLNEQRLLFTGPDPHAGYGDTWTAYVHPDDLNNVQDALSEALKNHQPYSKEYRLRRADGEYRWMFDLAAARVNGDGSFAGFISSAVDVTDQKLAREALEKVSGQLIEAQEKERSRLARELHDDICQRLAMISLKIEKATKGGHVSVVTQLEQIWQQCSTLAGDVQALSHELHPSILYNLGLATAVKSFCREVSEQQNAVVDYVASDIPNPLPREVSLSLFRVVQEALHNAVKYSGQKHFAVCLQGKDGEIGLEVIDRGIGFDPAKIKGGGLGLVSMAERIHQVNGTFKIDSQPNGGTRIHVRVPLAAQSKATAASAN